MKHLDLVNDLPHRLWGMNCYLGGPMDRAPDGGVQWRVKLTPVLQSLGIVVRDPCDKHIDVGVENCDNREYRHELKESGQFDLMVETSKPIRPIDLRMVDLSDFLIVNLDLSLGPFGTNEELNLANRQKKPIFFRCKQGKKQAPDWLFFTLPHQFIFHNWISIKIELIHLHIGPLETSSVHREEWGRWRFFDYAKLRPRVTPEQSVKNAMDFAETWGG